MIINVNFKHTGANHIDKQHLKYIHVHIERNMHKHI